MDDLKFYSALASVLIMFITSAFAIGKRLAKLEATDEAQEFKIRIIWEWLMRKSIPEGIEKGAITVNSPIKPTDIARALFEPVKEKLRMFLNGMERAMDEYELEIAVVSLLGVDFLENEICKPLGLDRGSCIKAAVAYARELNDAPESTP